MVRTTTVQFIDDIDGSGAAETVRFAVDGRSYEIDLSTENAEGLRSSLARFIAAARRSDGGNSGTKRGRGRSRQPEGPGASAVRAWASENGVAVSGRGRIPGAVLAQYTRAQQAPAAKSAPAQPESAEPVPAGSGDKPKRSRRKRG